MADQGWYIDSGATHHITNNLQNLYIGLIFVQPETRSGWPEPDLNPILPTPSFNASKLDTSLFIQHTTGDIMVVLIYVDDILVTGSNNKLVEKIINRLGFEFALKNLGDFNYLLVLK